MKKIEKSGDESTKYPSLSEIIVINEKVRKRYILFDLNGGRNLIHPDIIEHALNAIKFPIFGFNLHPGVFSKTAYLSYTIIKRHPFFTFNEETGLLVAKLFLKKNGFTLLLPRNCRRVIIDIIEGKMNQDNFKNWLRKNCVKID